MENAETEAVIEWNFGDGTELTSGSEVLHVFAEGTYTITAILMDSDCPWDGPYTITTEIVVSPCWLNLSYVQMKEGFYTFTAVGYPEKYPMYWEMGDGTSIIETWVVDHQYAPGTYEVCAWITSDFCYVDTLEACITFTYEITQSLSAIDERNEEIYPNPTSRFIHLSDEYIDHISIISGDGRLVAEMNHAPGTIDLEPYPDGIYVVTIQCGDEQSFSKRIVLRRD